MRRTEISPAIIAALRNRDFAAPFREVQVPLHLELPRYDQLQAPSYVEFDAEDARVEAESLTIDPDADDDFY